MTNAVDPKTFFPDLKENLTMVTWAHATNTKALLSEALTNPKVMMVEADVVLGTVGTNKTVVPIMAHPPASESDLSLQEFVDTVNKENKEKPKKGVKLDFKTYEAFNASKAIIEKGLNNGTYPVFINADIFAGPVDAEAAKVTPNTFLNDVKKYDNVTLSLGWTTKVKDAKNASLNGSYTAEKVKEMIDTVTLQKLSQPITYAVRAKFVAATGLDQIKLLVNNTLETTKKNSTLTIWSPDDEVDEVDAKKLSALITDSGVGVKNVYLDVPEKLMSKLDLNGASGITVTTMTLLGSLFVNFFLTVMPRRG
ncbi:protein FAM151B isoform X2 [Halictus rubicundus]